MKCIYCNKEVNIPSTGEELIFCNNLCKYLWEKRKDSPVQKSTYVTNEEKRIFLDNLDFTLDLDGFQNRNLLIRGSYWHGAVLYLDGKKVKPVEKKIFKRRRKYFITNNYGNQVEIILQFRPLDAIPGVFVNGQKIELFEELKWYEYVWMTAPFFLLFGGAIGGTIGFGALFTNSMILRKTTNRVLKYFLTGLNTVFAYLLFFQIIGLISPYVNTFLAKSASTASVDKQLIILASEVNKNTPFMVDSETRLDNAIAVQGKCFIYNYTMINTTSDQVDTVSAKEFMRPNMVNMVKADPSIKIFRDYETILLYTYRDKNGNYIMQIRIDPEDYK